MKIKTSRKSAAGFKESPAMTPQTSTLNMMIGSQKDLISVQQRRQVNASKQTLLLHDLKYAN